MPVIKTRGGNVNEGPERWVRARENAERNPHSGGAKLYRKREKLAEELHLRFPQDDTYGYTVLRRIYPNRVRKFHVCSVRCLGFQMQLDVGTSVGSEQVTPAHYSTLVARAVAEGAPVTHTWQPRPDVSNYERTLTIQTLDKAALPRPVTCRVCGVRMLGDKQTVQHIAAAAQPDTTKYVVTSDGRLLTLDKLRVVELTARDYELLCVWSTPELRVAYGEANGFPLSEA